jgi:hypothetical protein
MTTIPFPKQPPRAKKRASGRVIVAFKRPEKSIVEKLIAFLDRRGEFCHAEIFFPDRQESFSCHAGTGAIWRHEPVYDPKCWELVPVTWDEEKSVLVCEAVDGDHYDYVGVVNFLLRRWIGFQLPRIKGWWFCSAEVSLVGALVGKRDDLDHCVAIGPNELYKILTKKQQ